MLPGLEMLACPNLAVSPQVMQHVVQVESGANPYAIGVVGAQLARQPRNMEEALATARMLESKGYNFSVGIAQVNRSNLGRYGLDSYRKAFTTCDNLAAGAQILAGCYDSARGDWGKAFSCYYSGNFTTGFRDGYVQKVYASINRSAEGQQASTAPTAKVAAIPLAGSPSTATTSTDRAALRPVVVYSSDSAGYRVALRSVAVNAAAAALAPLVVSAAQGDMHGGRHAIANTGASGASPSTTARGAAPERPSANTPAQRLTPPTIARSTANSVFEPQVRGPNDPPTPAARLEQATTAARADGADLRMEQRDAAFVF